MTTQIRTEPLTSFEVDTAIERMKLWINSILAGDDLICYETDRIHFERNRDLVPKAYREKYDSSYTEMITKHEERTQLVKDISHVRCNPLSTAEEWFPLSKRALSFSGIYNYFIVEFNNKFPHVKNSAVS